ncbi:MAG: SpoIIE family protein phosphatase [Coriobacteriia bacterium]|nr:SpoIIE family protein phosphatase [Coriobacteriia bacterium]
MTRVDLALHVLDSLPMPVAYFDREGVCRLCNPSAAGLFRRSREAVLGLHLEVLAEDNPQLLSLARWVLGGQGRATRMLRFPLDGGTVAVLLSAIPHAEEGELVGVLLTGVDATQATEALREARREIADHKRGLAEALWALDIIEEPMLALPAELRGIEFAAVYRSASRVSRVGGDFYDIIELAPYSYAVLIGDVSGKGTEAAPVTSTMKQGVRAFASEGYPPSAVFLKLNRGLVKSLPTEIFVTATLLLFDARSGEIVWANAGHPPGIAVVADGTTLLEPTGPVLGVLENASYTDGRMELPFGGYLLLYTDGVVEARRDGAFFGEKRLLQVVSSLARSTTQQVVDAVYAEVSVFTASRFDDDIAMLALARSRDGGE